MQFEEQTTCIAQWLAFWVTPPEWRSLRETVGTCGWAALLTILGPTWTSRAGWRSTAQTRLRWSVGGGMRGLRRCHALA